MGAIPSDAIDFSFNLTINKKMLKLESSKSFYSIDSLYILTFIVKQRSIYLYIRNTTILGVTSCKEKFRKENFQAGFMVDEGGFLSYSKHKLIKFEKDKRFGLKKEFFNYKKREINTF